MRQDNQSGCLDAIQLMFGSFILLKVQSERQIETSGNLSRKVWNENLWVRDFHSWRQFNKSIHQWILQQESSLDRNGRCWRLRTEEQRNCAGNSITSMSFLPSGVVKKRLNIHKAPPKGVYCCSWRENFETFRRREGDDIARQRG